MKAKEKMQTEALEKKNEGNAKLSKNDKDCVIY